MNIRLVVTEQLAALKVRSGIPVPRAIEEAEEEVLLILVFSELESQGLFGHVSTAIH
jgi:hypothetical protein